MQLVYALLIYCKGNTIHREKRNILRFSVLKITQVESVESNSKCKISKNFRRNDLSPYRN